MTVTETVTETQAERWVFTFDEGYYTSDTYPSREDALAAAEEECRDYGHDDRWVWTGRAVEILIADVFGGYVSDGSGRLAGMVLDWIADSLYDEVGDLPAENWETRCRPHEKDLNARLDKAIGEWMEAHNLKLPYRVVDTEEHPLSDLPVEEDEG